jgi:hypothetical protein
MKIKKPVMRSVYRGGLILFCLAVLLLAASPAYAGEDLYRELSRASRDSDLVLYRALNEEGRLLDWESADAVEFEGNLRFLEAEKAAPDEELSGLYLVRRLDGELFILSLPSQAEQELTGTIDFYSSLDNVLGDKLVFKGLLAEGTVLGESYTFIRFTEKPSQLLLDRIFKTSIMFMFFFVMLGMGLTLALKDFVLVFKNRRRHRFAVDRDALRSPGHGLCLRVLSKFPLHLCRANPNLRLPGRCNIKPDDLLCQR